MCNKVQTRLNTHSVPTAGKYYFYCKCRTPKAQKSLVLSKEPSKEPSKELYKEPSKELSKEPSEKP